MNRNPIFYEVAPGTSVVADAATEANRRQASRESSTPATVAAQVQATASDLLSGVTTSARVDPDGLGVTADHPERVSPFWRA